MCTSLILILGIVLSVRQTTAQMPNYFQSGNSLSIPSPGSWQSSGFPSSGLSSGQYQPYRAAAPSAASYSPRTQYQSPQLSTISQLSGYSGLSSPQSSPWSQYQPAGARSWSVPSSVPSYPSYAQPQSIGFAGYSRPTTTLRSPSAAPGSPFQSSWSINHNSPSPAQSQLSIPAQPQSYSVPSPVASPPTQSWSQQPAPVSQWRPPTTQTYSAPQPAPVPQWSPPTTQSYSAPQPAAPQPAPQPAPVTTSYQSPQNAQNQRPAPVHYANIGAQLQGDYKFGYHTGDGGSFREETRLPDGTVQGAYGFTDADGKQRVVRYRAGKDGFQAEGDDVPKGTPAAGPSSGGSAPSQQQQQQSSAPINIDEGAAFKSFSQG